MKIVFWLFAIMLPFVMSLIAVRYKPDIWGRINIWADSQAKWKIYIALFFVCILLEGPLVFLKKVPFVADELYSISGAAYFAGYDWSSYMKLQKFYNFGYTMLLAPIYKLFTDPVAIYRAMLFMNVLLHIMTILMAYYIISEHFKFDCMHSIVAALICTCNSIVIFFKEFVYNEMPLTVIVWGIILLLFELIDSKGVKKMALSALLGFVSAYSYIVHSRCLIIFVALAIVIVFGLFVYKKLFVSPISFAGIFGISVYLEKLLINYVRKNLYMQDISVAAKNTVERVATDTWKYAPLQSLGGLKRLCLQIISLFGTVSVETGGLIIIVTAVVIVYIVKNKNKIIKGKESQKLFVLFLFSGILFWGMAACVGLYGAANKRLVFLVYTRYFSPFIGLYILIGLRLLNEKWDDYKFITMTSAFLYLLVLAVFVFLDYPLLNGQGMTNNASLYLWVPFEICNGATSFNIITFIFAFSLLIIFTIFQLFFLKKKRFAAFCCVGLCFSIFVFSVVEKKEIMRFSEFQYELSDATYKTLKNADFTDDYKIACIGKDNYRKSVLFSLYDKDIRFVKNINEKERTILLTDKIKIIKKYKPTYVISLDDNEWIGVWDEKPYTNIKSEHD